MSPRRTKRLDVYIPDFSITISRRRTFPSFESAQSRRLSGENLVETVSRTLCRRRFDYVYLYKVGRRGRTASELNTLCETAERSPRLQPNAHVVKTTGDDDDDDDGAFLIVRARRHE